MPILKANLKFAFKIILMVQASVDNILVKEDREYFTQVYSSIFKWEPDYCSFHALETKSGFLVYINQYP